MTKGRTTSDQPPGAAGWLIRTEPTGTTSAVSVIGELDLAVAPELEAAIADAFARAPERLVIDLSETTFIDSSGITALLRAHRHPLARSVALAIIPAADPVQATFALVGVDSVLPFSAPSRATT
jgi:anti-sigma B factor antagonist